MCATKRKSFFSIPTPGSGYKLLLKVVQPSTVDFSVEVGPFEVKERVLAFKFEQANLVGMLETVPLKPAYNVSVYDVANGMTVNNTGDRNT